MKALGRKINTESGWKWIFFCFRAKPAKKDSFLPTNEINNPKYTVAMITPAEVQRNRCSAFIIFMGHKLKDEQEKLFSFAKAMKSFYVRRILTGRYQLLSEANIVSF